MNAVIQRFLFPPGIILLTLAVVWWWMPRSPRKARRLLGLIIVIFYGISLPVAGNLSMTALESIPPLTPAQIASPKAQAIVILGRGRYPAAPEYGGRDTVNTGGLARIRYGAWLHRRTGLPILTAGGQPFREGESEAMVMKRALEEEFGVPVRWTEDSSNNTLENARNTQRILAAEGIDHVILVTHGNHMPRALWTFRQAGLEVTPGPTLFQTGTPNTGILDWLPQSCQAVWVPLHEYLGLLWYKFRCGDCAAPS
ncbi:MAG: YdcF family protein [Magnetococcales bacterium]|nr:YdcF family protein [Magnetococcales bacterium]